MKPLLNGICCLLFFASCTDHKPTANNKSAPVLAPLSTDTAGPVLQNSANPFAPVDVSPMDIAYFPEDYPIAKMTNPNIDPPKARIIYSRPHKQGRAVFGSLLKYGEHWRLGANEATELELFSDAVIQNTKVAKGRYMLYSIPQAGNWIIVFNRNVYSWGLKQDTARDVHRFTIPMEQAPAPIEFYTMAFQKTDTGAALLMAWDNAMARLPISFQP